jgi:2-methylfumaryl-CoA hydratase
VTRKSAPGNYFEDFSVGQTLDHATPRTLNVGDSAWYMALYGSRFVANCSSEFARAIGFNDAPLDDFLVFHTVFGKSVPDISLNAVANLGYADVRFGAPVYAGDTISATSSITGLKQNSSGKTGTVYVATRGTNQRGEDVLAFNRWVMVKKQYPDSAAPQTIVPTLPSAVTPDSFSLPQALKPHGFDFVASGSPHVFEDYAVGECIDHVDGITVEESEHMSAARLYQNTARVHFNQHVEGKGRFGRRIVYGGHIISIARALSFNGLANAFKIVAVNAGSHVSPVFAGHTVYAWSEVLEKLDVPGHAGVGALRIRTIACKDHACDDFPLRDAENRYEPHVVLDFDYTVVVPRASTISLRASTLDTNA